MSTIAEAAPTAASASSLLHEHRPWWRSRVTLSAAILGVMLVCYFGLKGEYSWPGGLVWTALPTHLNDFQTWLVDQRNADNPSPVVGAFNGFASFLDDLVVVADRLSAWMTWIGTAVVGVLVAVRFGGSKAADMGDRGIRDVRRQRALAREHADARADARGSLLSLLVGIPLGIAAGRSGRFHRAITPVPRRRCRSSRRSHI